MPAQLLALLLMLCLALPLPAQVRSQRSPRSLTKESTLAVDVVSFRQGKPARGLIMPVRQSTSPDAWLMMVEREELQHENATLYDQAWRRELEIARQAWSQLKERLEKVLANNQLPDALRAFYEREYANSKSELANLDSDMPLGSRFMWLEFRQAETSSIRRCSPEAQRIAIWAWNERLVDVTRQERAELQRQLLQQGVKLELKLPDLSKQLPPLPQSELEWSSRLAVVRYALANGWDFQGSQGIYVRSGSQLQAADMASLLQRMMGGNLEALLQDLDPAARAQARQARATWYQSVISQVEAAGHSEYRITRLDQDPNGQQATVETALVARLPQSGWQIIWSAQHTVRVDQIPAEAEKRIGDDPQVQAALALLASFGVAAESEVKKAIRFGAATQAAQGHVDSRFFEFRDTYVQRLDGPPLP